MTLGPLAFDRSAQAPTTNAMNSQRMRRIVGFSIRPRAILLRAMRPSESPPRKGLPEVPYGTVVGSDYMVVRPLGKGSMGALYVAEQLSTAHFRALKVLRREYIADDTLFKRFEREAQMEIGRAHV